MEEKTQNLLIILQEAENILANIKIVTEEKKLLNEKIKSVNDIVKQLKNSVNNINIKYNDEEKQIKELIQRIEYIKFDVMGQNIKSFAKLIMSNLPNNINKMIVEDNGAYKIIINNSNNQYIGNILLYKEDMIIADISFNNSKYDERIIIEDIFKIYSIINKINMIIGYGEYK